MRTRPPRSEPDSSVQGQTRKDAGRHDCTSEHDIAAYQPDHRQPGQPCREPARQPEGEEDGDERQCQQLCPEQPRHRYERNDVAEARGQSGGDSPARGPESLETQFCVRVGSHRMQFGKGFGDLACESRVQALGLVNPTSSSNSPAGSASMLARSAPSSARSTSHSVRTSLKRAPAAADPPAK